jgi:hypothetical protein
VGTKDDLEIPGGEERLKIVDQMSSTMVMVVDHLIVIKGFRNFAVPEGPEESLSLFGGTMKKMREGKSGIDKNTGPLVFSFFLIEF